MSITTGGGSGSDDDGDDSTDTGSTTVVGNTIRFVLPGWVLALAPLAPIANTLAAIVQSRRARQIFILSALTSLSVETIAELLQVKSPVAILIDDYLYRTILFPIGEELVLASINIVTSLIIIAFGSDGAVGVSPGSTVGIVDIPIVVVSPAIRAILRTGIAVYSAVDAFNQTLAQGLSGLGVAAPIFVTFFWAVEISVIGYLVWLALTFVPFINIPGILRALVSPATRIWRRFG